VAASGIDRAIRLTRLDTQGSVGDPASVFPNFQDLMPTDLAEFRPSTSSKTAIDFAIVTVLDHEREAMLQHVSDVQRERFSDDPITYYRGRLGQYSVVVLQQTRMGNLDATLTVRSLTERYDVQAVLLVGIAAGDKKKMSLGDILVATEIVYCESGKIVEEGKQYRAQHFPVSEFLSTRARDVPTNWEERLTTQRPDETDKKPSVVRGVIAACENVVASQEKFEEIQREVNGMVGLAMEGGGAAWALHRDASRVGILEIRGVCDFADECKNDAWQPYAAQVAAAFVAMFLEDLDLIPVGTGQPGLTQANIILAIRLEGYGAVVDGVLPQLTKIGSQAFSLPLDINIGDPPDARRVGSVVNTLHETDGSFMKALASVGSVAIYGHAAVPMAALVGFFVGSRRALSVYDAHRFVSEADQWKWPNADAEPYPPLSTPELSNLERDGEIVLRVSISARVRMEDIDAVSPYAEAWSEIGLANPSVGAIRSAAQIRAYAAAFRAFLDRFSTFQARVTRLHVCYAGPIPLAVAMGAAILSTVDPPIVFWHYDHGYQWGLDISAAARGLTKVEWAQTDL
jgi:nucleoside phosphorylase